jgi:hypothetical protein
MTSDPASSFQVLNSHGQDVTYEKQLGIRRRVPKLGFSGSQLYSNSSAGIREFNFAINGIAE